MGKVNWKNVTDDFAIFTASISVIIAVLWAAHIKVSILCARSILGCAITLGILAVVSSIPYFNKPSTRKDEAYGRNNGEKFRNTTASDNVKKPDAPTDNKSYPNNSHSRIRSFLAKIKERYTITLIIALCYIISYSLRG